MPDEPRRPPAEGHDLFAEIYGKPDPATLRPATVITVLSGDEADRHIGRELTDAQRAGLAAQVDLEQRHDS